MGQGRNDENQDNFHGSAEAFEEKVVDGCCYLLTKIPYARIYTCTGTFYLFLLDVYSRYGFSNTVSMDYSFLLYSGCSDTDW